MRLIILAACLWFVTTCLHAKIVFTSRRDSNFIEAYTMNSDGKRDRIVVATLDMNLLSVVAEAEVPIPPMVAIQSVSFGADGRSVLFVGFNSAKHSSFRARLDTNELIQLTDAPFGDYSLQEWARGLSVSPKQEVLPQIWGRIKAKASEQSD